MTQSFDHINLPLDKKVDTSQTKERVISGTFKFKKITPWGQCYASCADCLRAKTKFQRTLHVLVVCNNNNTKQMKCAIVWITWSNAFGGQRQRRIFFFFLLVHADNTPSDLTNQWPPVIEAALLWVFVELKCSQPSVAHDWTTLVPAQNLFRGQTDVGKCQKGPQAVWVLESWIHSF